jgi:hypothetical protein
MNRVSPMGMVVFVLLVAIGYVWVTSAIWLTVDLGADGRAGPQRVVAIASAIPLAVAAIAAALGKWPLWLLAQFLALLGFLVWLVMAWPYLD